ncbi:MAG TPA: ribbon-helix-helix protein, CopG family [Candidatus Latescibacteria bacterium]|nr:ribbon-helix-helix protein, CopG family [Candidatus Latescibacterota bacterium]HPC45008.1 ribbon-helix-helix protein, CopG family [Candidatus Latescibacterota bacterium]HQE62873.1 ribbon-helix-helix protein, CopG family [Candidatus Latescibacterota bacterium]HQI77502.1 ribbon-helix-helix protein, CopG family [Candidatus Latescibacterota bacterium]HQK23541.1 ribbon-helix-helix protein, CopG family [Candidatus Latescibacterota bacterium]
MRTVQLTLDENLVRDVDRLVKQRNTTRSAFTRDALQEAIKAARTREMEEKHRAGYRKLPVRKGEFSVWEGEQEWGDE